MKRRKQSLTFAGSPYHEKLSEITNSSNQYDGLTLIETKYNKQYNKPTTAVLEAIKLFLFVFLHETINQSIFVNLENLSKVIFNDSLLTAPL